MKQIALSALVLFGACLASSCIAWHSGPVHGGAGGIAVPGKIWRTKKDAPNLQTVEGVVTKADPILLTTTLTDLSGSVATTQNTNPPLNAVRLTFEDNTTMVFVGAEARIFEPKKYHEIEYVTEGTVNRIRSLAIEGKEVKLR